MKTNYQKIYKNLTKEIKKLSKKDSKKLENLIKLLYELSVRDQKTGLFNFNFFNEILKIEIENSKRKNSDICLILIDIDNFKKINEIYGYFFGDKIIVYFSKLIKNIVRKGDIIARFGGDEFIILLPLTSLNKAIKVSKRIKKSIEDDSFLKKYNIKASIGVSSFSLNDTQKTFFEKSNKALNYAKKTGKNKIVVYENLKNSNL